jgi:hypothetical protein
VSSKEKSMSDRVTPPREKIRAAGVEPGGDRTRMNAMYIARRAANLVARLTGRRPERVISVEPADGGWKVGVEVVEMSRIPDSADIVGVHEVRLDRLGDLVSYQRIRRYVRGDVSRGCAG